MAASINQLAEIANNWKAADNSSLSILTTWYQQQTGKALDCFNCDGKKQRYFSEVIAYLSNIKLTGMKVTTKWKLKSNNAYPLRFGGGDFISNAAMTDDKAIAFLKENPNRIQIFSEYPSDWAVKVGSVVVNSKPKKVDIKEPQGLKTRAAKK